MKKLIRAAFNLVGIEVSRKKTSLVSQLVSRVHVHTMKQGLQRMKSKGILPATIIDLGAASGHWSVSALECWPSSQYVLFEPLLERKEVLDQLCVEHKNFFVVTAAAGAKKEQVQFSVTADLDGSGFYDSEENSNTRKVDVTTIDYEINKMGLKSPFFIKFDTHGFEVPILEGAKDTLKKTEGIVMESYGFRISKNCLTIHQMIVYMEKLGFRLADIVDVMRRPGDELFWQCDLFFLRADHHLFKRTSYAA